MSAVGGVTNIGDLDVLEQFKQNKPGWGEICDDCARPKCTKCGKPLNGYRGNYPRWDINC